LTRVRSGKTSTRRSVLAWTALVLAMLIWAVSFFATKDVLGVVDPMMLLVLRFAVGALALAFPVGRLYGFRLERRDILPLSAAALLSPVAYYTLQTYGLRITTPSHVAGISAVFPVLVYVCAIATRRESAVARRIAGVLLGASGIALIASSGLLEPGASLRGDLVVLLAMVFSAAQIVWLKEILKRIPPIKLLFYHLAIAVVVLAPASFGSGTEWVSQLSPLLVAELVFLGLFSSAGAFALHYYALQRLPATNVATATGLVPVITIALDLALFGLRPSALKLLGVALVLGGILLTQTATGRAIGSPRYVLDMAGGRGSVARIRGTQRKVQ